MALEKLRAARNALESADSLLALRYLEDFQRDLPEFGGVDVEALAGEVRGIHEFAEAALAGMASALEVIRKLQDIAYFCDIYGPDGKRLSHPAAPGNISRF